MPMTRPSGAVRFTATCDHEPGAKPLVVSAWLGGRVLGVKAYEIDDCLSGLEQFVLFIELQISAENYGGI